MKYHPTLSILDPHDDDAVMIELNLIPEADVGAFTAEIASELGAMLDVTRETALAMFTVALDLRGPTASPVPECFELSPAIRRGFAKDVAGVVRAALGAVARSAA